MINEPVIVLIGGLGTRLRSLYPDRPKALAPVSGKPFIAWMMGWLHRQGVGRVHLAAGYRADQVVEWSKTFTLTGLEISVSIEPSPLGTAGGVKYALHNVSHGDRILVMNGDSLLPGMELSDLVSAGSRHERWKAIISAVEMTERGQYGTVELDPGNRVVAFREKADNERGWVNGGIYYLDPDIFNGIEEGMNVSMEKTIFPELAVNGAMGAVRVQGPLLDMGTPEGLRTMERYIG